MRSSLERFPAFAGLEAGLLDALAPYLEPMAVPDGTRLIAEGDEDPTTRCLYLVVDGRCVVERSREGDAPLRFPVESGELFGVLSLVDGRPRGASVAAEGPVELLRLDNDAFQAIRDRGDALSLALELVIARQIARDFSAMNERLAMDVAGSPAPPSEQPEWATMTCYSGLASFRAELHRPASLAAVAEVLDTARRQGRRVTLRGEGLSFDTQAMGSDVVLSLRRFDEIEVDAEARTVTVGAGATWGAIVAATAPHGLVPAVVVSGSDVTAAGTIACNALSRFSPRWGKEGRWVRALDVLLPGGERVRASREEHPALFHAVIGGFGLVAIVIRATYALVPVGHVPIRVRSQLERVPDVDALAAKLRVAPDRDPQTDTPYAFVAISGDAIRSVVTRSTYVGDLPLRTLLPHRRGSAARMPVELAIHNLTGAGQRFWNFAYDRVVDETRPYVDELEGYTFFMDGNLRAHRSASRLGVPFRTIQQTLVLPSDGPTDLLAPFVRRARDVVRDHDLDLALLDVLHLPTDEPFALSSTRPGPGFAVTLTFEGIHDVPTIQRLRGRLVELTQEVRRVGGRVHLTKNVFATRDDLEAMYGEGLAELARVKAETDPHALLASDFADRVFPALRG